MFRSWTGLNKRSLTFAVYFTATSLQALNKENDMISREEPAKINNVDSVVSVNTCDKAKRKKNLFRQNSVWILEKKFLIIFGDVFYSIAHIHVATAMIVTNALAGVFSGPGKCSKLRRENVHWESEH